MTETYEEKITRINHSILELYTERLNILPTYLARKHEDTVDIIRRYFTTVLELEAADDLHKDELETFALHCITHLNYKSQEEE